MALLILLGIFGIHRFYTGHTKAGLLYLFTFGIFGIGVLYDMILLLRKRFVDSRGLYILNSKSIELLNNNLTTDVLAERVSPRR